MHINLVKQIKRKFDLQKKMHGLCENETYLFFNLRLCHVRFMISGCQKCCMQKSSQIKITFPTLMFRLEPVVQQEKKITHLSSYSSEKASSSL